MSGTVHEREWTRLMNGSERTWSMSTVNEREWEGGVDWSGRVGAGRRTYFDASVEGRGDDAAVDGVDGQARDRLGVA